jgi:hypothetical protein
LHIEVDAGALDGGIDLCTRSDDARVEKQSINVFLGEAGDSFRRKLFEGSTEGFAFTQNDDPRKPGLKALKDECAVERPYAVFGAYHSHIQL